MKQIFLSEGKYDVFLLENILDQYDCSVKKFLKEEIEKTRYRNKQSNIIRNFIESRSPIDALIKSEGGKQHLLTFFSIEAIHLVRNIERVVVVIDLDSVNDEGLESLKEKLCEKIENRHRGSNYKVKVGSILGRNEDMIAFDADIGSEGKFLVIAWKPSLEIIAGIDKKRDTKAEKEQKILNLLDDDVIMGFFRGVLG